MNAVFQNIKNCLKTHEVRLPNASHKALVMYSGGLDSFSLLYNLLHFDMLDIHAHHIEINNFEKRATAEKKAISLQLRALGGIRNFEYSTSQYTMNIGKGGGLDLTLAAFYAARVHTASEYSFDTVWTGHIATPLSALAHASSVLNAELSSTPKKLIWMRPLLKMSKQNIATSIDQRHLAFTWSCRRPIHSHGAYLGCGTCHACKTRASNNIPQNSLYPET